MGLSRKVEDLERFEEVVQILFGQQLGFVLDKLNLEDRLPVAKELTAKRHRKPGPVRVRETLEELGPVYIKFGQMLAQRKDLVPEEYAEELKKLENRVPEFDGEKAKNIVEREIGMEHFSSFDTEPVASASIAQVHRAILESGEEVAVKVRRPGIVEQVDKDTDILYYFARRLEKLGNVGNQQLSKDVNRFAEWTEREVNLENEASNSRRMKKVVEDQDGIRIPDLYEDLCTERVLVTEYVDAVRVDNLEKLDEFGVDVEEIVERGLRAQMLAVFKHGFFHADPHPSNFLVEPDGTLVFLDFGIVGRLSRKKRKDCFLMFYSMSRGDPEGVVQGLLEISTVEEDADVDALKSLVESEVLQIQGKTIGEKSVAKTFAKISMRSMDYGVYVPNDLIVMGKGLTTLEGIGLDISPDFNVAERNREFMEELLKDQMDPEQTVQELTADILRNRELFEKFPSKLNELMDTQEQKIVVKNNNSTDTMAPGIVIASSIFLGLSLPTRYGIAAGAAGLGLAYYLHQR